MWPFLRRISLTHWIMISMVAGIAFGHWFPTPAMELKIVSTVFLSMIKCILVPLVFSTLVVGIAGHADDMKAVGRLAIKSIFYFEVVTTLGLVIGLVAVNVFRPGDGLVLPPPGSAVGHVTAEKVTLSGIFVHIVPQSFFAAAAANDVLQVVFFAILFGIALAQVERTAREPVLRFCESLMETMFKFTALVMKFAPFGIGAAMAYTVAHSGIDALKSLLKLIITLYGALLVFGLTVLLPAALWARVPVLRFLKLLKEPILLAFTTTSSDAAMPDAMKRLIYFGVPKRIVSFVMPIGYSFNLDGSTLYLAVASIFIAQAAKVELSLTQQVVMMLTLMLTSKGMAGIPRASQVVLAGTLVSFGLPLEGVLVIMGVDEIMDMGRTTVNLVGNCLATAVIARWEGEFPPPSASAKLA